MFKKMILCLQNGSFFFVSDSKHFEFNRSPHCYLGIRFGLGTYNTLLRTRVVILLKFSSYWLTCSIDMC